jgi:hypothetical protein
MTDNELKKLVGAEGEEVEHDPVVTFLYVLMRDHLPLGNVANVIIDLEAGERLGVGFGYTFTNEHLAGYARELRDRLARLEPADLGEERPPSEIPEEAAKRLGVDIIDMMDRAEVPSEGPPPPKDLDPLATNAAGASEEAVEELKEVAEQVGATPDPIYTEEPEDDEDDATPVPGDEEPEGTTDAEGGGEGA